MDLTVTYLYRNGLLCHPEIGGISSSSYPCPSKDWTTNQWYTPGISTAKKMSSKAQHKTSLIGFTTSIYAYVLNFMKSTINILYIFGLTAM